VSTQLKPLSQGAVWGPRQARHLLNRAGFGVPQSSVETLVKMGPRKAVDSLVQYEKYADNLTEPDFLSPPVEPEEMRQMAAGLSQEERTKLGQEMQQQQREEVEKLKAWWLDRMSITARPLQEKLTLFWHGHFATSSDKVKQAISNYELNKVFRRNAAGNFRTLVFEVGKSGAMLRYLDNNQNRKGHPNENWARELMELFTLGIGNYTEEDIKEAARAFSGYTDKGGEFYFNNRQHDYGEKTFLGKTGDLDGADVINTIFEQPQAARFISRKLWEYFVYEEPSKELVEELAGVLRANDYELKPLLETIFLSEEFYGTKALNGQIKSPVQFVVMMMDQLQHRPERRMLLNLALRGLGQDLFQPPNVKGWPGNRAWINTNTLMLRYNIPAYLVLGGASEREAGVAAGRDGDESPEGSAGNGRAPRKGSRAACRAAAQEHLP
jgi:uncharacterized protein (DUF1800 family)